MSIPVRRLSFGAAVEFVSDFKEKLRAKRLKQAKYRLLERYKAHFWTLFEEGMARRRQRHAAPPRRAAAPLLHGAAPLGTRLM